MMFFIIVLHLNPIPLLYQEPIFIYINLKYPNNWLKNSQFSVKFYIFKSAVWVFWVEMNEIVYLV